jgi:hypothetical protein
LSAHGSALQVLPRLPIVRGMTTEQLHHWRTSVSEMRWGALGGWLVIATLTTFATLPVLTQGGDRNAVGAVVLMALTLLLLPWVVLLAGRPRLVADIREGRSFWESGFRTSAVATAVTVSMVLAAFVVRALDVDLAQSAPIAGVLAGASFLALRQAELVHEYRWDLDRERESRG